jgi:RNA polymerase sigma factor (sigma-70 family)
MVADTLAALVPAASPDADLLARFALDRDDSAFAELVRRHGPMVLGVCRGTCGNAADADDAFQAVFVVLAREAHTLVGRGALGAWLHGVARRAALKARAVALKRRAKEARAAKPEGASAPEPADALALIEGEVARLPRLYREALVLCGLCGLCGRSRREVADELGVPEGTLASRLAKARELLAQRLKARGVCVPVAAVVVPSALAHGATQAATGAVPVAVSRIANGVVRAMFFSKLQPLALCFGVFVLCAFALAAAREPAPGAPAEEPKPAADKIENGVYLLLPRDGEGKKVTLTDGSELKLGKRFSAHIGKATELSSLSNDNTHFHLRLDDLDPKPPEPLSGTALVVDGVVVHIGWIEKLGRSDMPGDRGIAGATVYTEEAAKVVAKAYKIEPKLRKHPGHRIAVKWATEKREYAPGAAVNATMTITNTGTENLRFTHGGQQRGPRDNQFRFVAQQGSAGKGLPVIGGANNFGGISRSITLKPGESYSATVELTKWFKFEKHDTYRVTGIFEMPMIDPKSEDGFRPAIWDELAVGEFVVRIVEPPQPK